jgi:acetyltransferase-like isoleucine patch superfamily enzyme
MVGGLGQRISRLCRHILTNSRLKKEQEFGSPTALAFTLRWGVRRYGWTVGRYSYGDPQIWGAGEADLAIGSFVSIAIGCKIYLGFEHNTHWLTTFPFPANPTAFPNVRDVVGHPRTRGNVMIGNDVWIGSDVTILSGSTIGDGAVIGAKSLVSGSIPPYSIVGGVPARVIKYRFPPNEVETLLSLSWWDWPEADLQQCIPLLCSKKLDDLIAFSKVRNYQ